MMRGVATVFSVRRFFLIETVPSIHQTCRACATGHSGGGGGGWFSLAYSVRVCKICAFAF